MIKLKDLLEATSPVKIGSVLPGSGGRKKEIEIVLGFRLLIKNGNSVKINFKDI